MSHREYMEFNYVSKEDYDGKIKINGDDLAVYTKKQLNKLYPAKDYAIVGETYESKKRDKVHDIGRIELNEKRLNVSENGKHNKLFRKQSLFVETEGGYIAILKTRILPVFLIIALIFGFVGFEIYGYLVNHQENSTTEQRETETDIKPITPVVQSITGFVKKNGKPIENARVSLQLGNREVACATTDKDGKFLIFDIADGNYNLVISYGNSVMTQKASVYGESLDINCTFPADDLHDVEEITDYHEQENLPVIEETDSESDVKAVVKITDDKTPAVAVNGLSREAMLHMIAGEEVDLTFFATLVSDDSIPVSEKNAIQDISGELSMTYYNFSVLKEIFRNNVLESKEYLSNTKTVLEIAVPYDSSHSIGTYVFRYHGGSAARLEALSEKPVSNFVDGTCYISNDTVYIYSSCFSTYAVGAANTANVVRGSDTITYSSKATLDLNTNTISFLYKHDADSTNDAKIEIYLAGTNGNLLIAETGSIPVGYQIESADIKDGIKSLPGVGTYEGIMKIIYLGTDGNVSTNVDIPLTVAITK